MAVLGVSCGGKDRDLFPSDPVGVGPGSGAGGSTGGSAGIAGTGGSGSGGTGFGGSAGVGGSSAFGGVGGVTGVGGAGAADAGSCDFCADGDGDGHGDPSRRTSACDPGIGWVAVCDDCNDGNPDVFPGSTKCGSAPYVAADGVTPSFDYDCSGGASACMEVPKAVGNCAPMGFACSGSGYVTATSADSGVSDEAAAICGSTKYRVCNRLGIICTPTTETRDAVTCM